MTDYDQRLRQVTIGEPDRIDGPIHLAEYDPEWPRAFEREGIDIVLAVLDSADEPAYVPDMEARGYMLRIREPEWHEHRLFKRPDVDINLHVFTVGSPEIERMLRFRDWLREHPHERDLYLDEKRRLGARTWEYVQQYADAKGEVVEAILARAESYSPGGR